MLILIFFFLLRAGNAIYKREAEAWHPRAGNAIYKREAEPEAEAGFQPVGEVKKE